MLSFSRRAALDQFMWNYSQTSFQADDITLNGNRFLIGNGYLGFRGTLEEFGSPEKTACILNGVYDQVPGCWREPVNAPNGLKTTAWCRGRNLSVLSATPVFHEQTLHLRQAVHRRKTTFDCDGALVTVEAERFASQADPHLLCMKFTVSSSVAETLRIQTGVDTEVWDINGPHLVDVSMEREGAQLVVHAKTREIGTDVVVCETVDLSGLPSAAEISWNGGFRDIEFQAAPGEVYEIYKFVSVFTSLDASSHEIRRSATSLGAKALQVGYATLRAAHVGRWSEIWERCDIQIEGDEEAQFAVRYSLYQLQSTAPRHSQRVSIPARGLSGQVYKGAVFWDTEMYMTPVFILTEPGVARNLILYRYHTLDGARRKAASYGFRGAFYAWESQETGDDACTDFNVTDVLTNRPLRTYFRDKQVHISADIVHSIRQYFDWTGDATILRDGAAEVLIECARFLFSYAYCKPENGRYELLDVVGPDEYHERVHNNAFTNRMTKEALQAGVSLLARFGAHYPEEYRDLQARLDFADELESWRVMQAALYLPQPDPKTGIIPQFDGYFALEDLSLEELKSRLLHPNEYLGGGSGVATTTQILKQADVVLMLNLFRDDHPMEIKRKNWEFYDQRTEHGSSLSACAHAMLAAHIGQPELAYPFFMKTATVDLTGASKQFVGDLYIGGTHPAANGGAWMAVAFGFAGLALRGDRVVLSPSLPAHWKSLAFQFQFQGQTFALRISDQGIRIASDDSNSQDIWFEVDGHAAAKCAAGESLTWEPWRTVGRTGPWQKEVSPPAEEKTEPANHPSHSFA